MRICKNLLFFALAICLCVASCMIVSAEPNANPGMPSAGTNIPDLGVDKNSDQNNGNGVIGEVPNDLPSEETMPDVTLPDMTLPDTNIPDSEIDENKGTSPIASEISPEVDDNSMGANGRIMGIVIAVIVAVAIIVLIVVLIPKEDTNKSKK